MSMGEALANVTLAANEMAREIKSLRSELSKRPEESYPGELDHLRSLLRDVGRLADTQPEGNPVTELLIDHYSDSRYVDGQLADAAVSGSTAGDEQSETTPWQQAVDGLNALVDAGIPVHIEPDGHIANTFGDEHIEWNRETSRWQLVMDEEVAS